MNVIIEIHGGIIENVLTCKCTAQAGLLYVEEAKEMGVELDEELIDKMSYSDMAISDIIDVVDSHFEYSEKELRWFESDHYKKVK